MFSEKLQFHLSLGCFPMILLIFLGLLAYKLVTHADFSVHPVLTFSSVDSNIQFLQEQDFWFREQVC